MAAKDRKAAIVSAAIPLFANRGFNGTTTREIAEAARISEALLYRYFPSKESLYHEIQSACCRGIQTRTQELAQREPSTSTLVLSVFLVMAGPIFGMPGDKQKIQIIRRLMLNSILEDGEFARILLKSRIADWLTQIEQSIQAAIHAGDMEESPITDKNKFWLCHHLGIGISNMFLSPSGPLVDYGMSKEKLVKEAVFFALRGIGLKKQAIEAHYHPETFFMFFQHEKMDG